MKKHVFPTIALAAATIAWLMSAPAAQAELQKLNLAELVDYSLKHNGELNSFREEKGIREANKLKSGLLPNPTLEIDGSSGALTGSSAESSISLGISQEFVVAGKREKRLAIARYDLEMHRWQLAERERILREELKTAFFSSLLSEQRVTLMERAIAINRQLLDVAGERLAAGDIPELERNLVKIELAKSEGSHLAAIRENKQRLTKLMTLSGAESSEQIAPSGDLAATRQLTNSLAELQNLARNNRPDLKSLEAERAKGEAEILLAKAESIPNLTAGLALRRDTAGMEIGGVEGRDTSYSIALKLSIPIPVFDANRSGVQEARAKKNSSDYRLAATLTTIEREVESSYNELQNSERILALYRDSILTQLDENLKLTQEAYRLGEVGILAVIQEQKKFFEVHEGYLTALYDRQAAFVRLETAVATELSGGIK